MPLRLGHPNPTRHQRLECSLKAASLTYAILVLGFALWAALAPVHGETSQTVFDRATDAASLAVIYGGVLCIVGWVVALPLVLTVRQLSGIGLWIMLLSGIALGPALILIIPALYSLFIPHANFTYSTLDRVFWHLVYLALAVSTATTVLYLLLLGRASRPQPHRDA